MRSWPHVPITFVLIVQLLTAVDYGKEIRPILDKHCIDCHGPDKQNSRLRVDQRAFLLRGGDSGSPAIVPGNPDKSHLIDLIRLKDPELRMPAKGDPLSAGEIALLEKWIADGAIWPGQMNAKLELETDHWSFQPVERPEVPQSAKHPIDAFLNSRMAGEDLKPNPPADPLSLIRRASIVLTGLPPEAFRVRQFLAEFSKDQDRAYLKLIDELLDSPHFGERWAQHWLDVIRWAETNGSESNLYRKLAWVYRDYVIRAFNDDVPYDRFVQEQLAGDGMGTGEALGFLVAGPHVPAATVGQQASAIRLEPIAWMRLCRPWVPPFWGSQLVVPAVITINLIRSRFRITIR